MRVQIKTIICSMLALMLCLGTRVVPVQAAETGKVRIGIYNEEGADDSDMYVYRAGYDYEYMTKVAEYAGWEYEIVEGSLQECISGMENGEIDIMGNIEKEDGREEVMEFTDMPSLYVGHCLLIEAGSESYNYEDFAAFDGMRIGMLEGCASNQILQEYAAEHGFDYTLEWYESDAELKDALAVHEIDCAYLSDFRNLEGYKKIAEFGNTPYYFAVSKKRGELTETLNRVLREIHEESHYYENELYSKYFTATVTEAFTSEEKEYLKENRVVQVMMSDGFPLICEYDPDTERYTGIVVDVLKKLAEKTGLQFEYQKMPEDCLPADYLKKHPNVIMAPLLDNDLIPCGRDIQQMEMIRSGKMVGICREGERLDFNQAFTIAIPKNMYKADEKLQKLYPKAKIVHSKTHEDGLRYVAQKKADITLVNEITGAYLLQSPYYEKLMRFHMDELSENITLGTALDSDPLLVSALNKAIRSLGEREVGEIFISNTASNSYSLSPLEWIYKNAMMIVLSLIAMIGVGMAIRWRSKRLKEEKAEEEELRLTRERLELKLKHQEEMFYQAKYDALTGFYNHQYFCEKSSEFIDKNPDITYAFLYINVEQFKMINEVYGWRYGDMVLQKVADIIREKVGDNGIYARSYSDHFAVCYPVPEEGLDIRPAETVEYLECEGHQIRVQVSVGIYLDNDHDRDVDRCMEYAQIALQNGRKSGKGYVHFYQKAYMENLKKNQKITNEMEQAMEEGQFRIFLQPQFDQIAGTLVGAEALARWVHPEEGLISPGIFIPVFEKNGFIGKLDAFVCEEACKLLAKWKKEGRMIPISVNLTRNDLMDEATLPTLMGLLEKYEIPIEYLHVEITESVYEQHQEKMIDIIDRFKEKGFIIEMDDFGSSYSSLNMLKDIPIDIIKMDMKFFEGEAVHKKGGMIVKGVVKLAHSLGVPVVAEGVETEADAWFLRGIDCHLVQGYLYGRPTEVEAFEELMRKCTVGEKQIAYSSDL